MNKGRRQELKQLKYKRRLKRIGELSNEALSNPVGVKDGVHYNFTGYKNSSNPCSCPVCSPVKYNRAKIKNADNGNSAIRHDFGVQRMAI